MGKSRIGVVVRESLGGNKSSSRSADLQKLYQNYQVWCKQIAALIQALKSHQQSLLYIEKTRTAVSFLICLVICLHGCLFAVFITTLRRPRDRSGGIARQMTVAAAGPCVDRI